MPKQPPVIVDRHYNQFVLPVYNAETVKAAKEAENAHLASLRCAGYYERLDATRKAKKLSWKELSLKCGFNAQGYSGLADVEDIAAALGVNPCWLAFGPDKASEAAKAAEASQRAAKRAEREAKAAAKAAAAAPAPAPLPPMPHALAREQPAPTASPFGVGPSES